MKNLHVSSVKEVSDADSHNPPGLGIRDASTAYALGLNEADRLSHRYWGVRLPYLEDYPAAANRVGWASFNGPTHLTPEEYPGYGGLSYIDPCLKVTFADGVRDLVLQMDSANQARCFSNRTDHPSCVMHIILSRDASLSCSCGL